MLAHSVGLGSVPEYVERISVRIQGARSNFVGGLTPELRGAKSVRFWFPLNELLGRNRMTDAPPTTFANQNNAQCQQRQREQCYGSRQGVCIFKQPSGRAVGSVYFG